MTISGREYHERRPFVAYCHDCGMPLQRGEGIRAQRYHRRRVVCRDRDQCDAQQQVNEERKRQLAASGY